MAKSSQLLMERGMVNMPVKDVCKGGQIRVAYNNLPRWFEVDMKNNEMVQFEYDGSQKAKHVTFPHEILYSFLIEHQLSPIFMYNQQNWASFDPSTGEWSGTVAMVRGDFIFVLVFMGTLKCC